MRELAPDAVERNYSKSPLTSAEVEQVLAAAPSLDVVINTRHAIAKARDWKTKSPSRKELLAAVLEDNNVLRRPIVLRDGRLVVGSDEAAIRALLA